MGFKCPICTKDFGRDKGAWGNHCSNAHLGVAEEVVSMVRNVAEEVGQPASSNLGATIHLTPLNGTKTHPLTAHAYEALERLVRDPVPDQELNPGVINRLMRESLIEIINLPNPYPTSRKKRPTIGHAKITETGRDALSNRPK